MLMVTGAPETWLEDHKPISSADIRQKRGNPHQVEEMFGPTTKLQISTYLAAKSTLLVGCVSIATRVKNLLHIIGRRPWLNGCVESASNS
jgi:hypothetical protein